MSSELITKSKEDYLEAILMITKQYGACRATDIATHLNFSKASVSVALKKLEEEGYVERDDWRIVLTNLGNKIAASMLDKHSFFKNLFIDMGIEPTTAESEACEVEHIISDNSFKKIVQYISEHNPAYFQ